MGGVFALAFLAAQYVNWQQLLALQAQLEGASLAAFAFYLLTGLHALHVLAGFVPLGWVLYRARQRQYSSSRAEGVRFCVYYWHLLGAIWLVLLLTLQLVFHD